MKTSKIIDTLVKPDKLVVRKSPLNGYGVFASDDILKGEIIEEAVFANTQLRMRELMYPEFKQICYCLPCNCDRCKWRGRTI